MNNLPGYCTVAAFVRVLGLGGRLIEAVLRQWAVTRDIFMLFSNMDRTRRYRLGDQDAALSRLKHGFESRYRYHV